MEVRCLTTGVVRPKRGDRGVRRYLPGGWSAETLPVNAFLVEHSGGLCLFDTGQAAEAAEPGYFPRWHPFFRLSRFELGPEDEAAAQLARLGVSPTDVRLVVLSHLHTDHVGGIGAFTGAEIVVSRLEWEAAAGLRGRLRGYLPERMPAALRPRLVEIDGPPLGPFKASLDLRGDGRLLLVPTPGHTAGHLSLLIEEEGRRYLLGGDLAHSQAHLEVVSPEISSFCREGSVTFLAAHDSRAVALLGGQTVPVPR
ncbi:MAG TPA: N-acyl homoserine lactonase family protein [Gaiellaceae bacterium]|nr:N-acyl homoserine lactonase family protein [Gaiellaceae bacterium]